nr:hypothetical protein [Candidatus Sigynarchaeum springense]
MVQVECKAQEGGDANRFGWIGRVLSFIQGINPLLEALLVYGITLCIGWLWLPAAFFTGSTTWYIAGWSIIGVFFSWMILLSHAARKRGFEELGFSSHRSFANKMEKVRKWGDKWNYMLIYGAIIAAYVIFMLIFVPFTGLIPIFGTLNDFIMQNASYSFFTFFLVTIEFIFFALITALFFFKTDNIKPSLKVHAKYGTPFLLFMFTWAILTSKHAYTETFMNVISHFLGYIYFALAQQVVTLVYVNTSAMEGLERSGLVKDPRRRRIISSIITASIFAAIHVPAIALSVIAFMMELIIAMLYSKKEYRNVFVACLFHAMVGVIVVLLMQIEATVGFISVTK